MDPHFNDMQPRFTLANHKLEKFLERESKKWSFGWFQQNTLIYITDMLPMFIRNIAILNVEIFHEELSVLKRENYFR